MSNNKEAIEELKGIDEEIEKLLREKGSTDVESRIEELELEREKLKEEIKSSN